MYPPPRAIAQVQNTERCFQNVPFGEPANNTTQTTSNSGVIRPFLSTNLTAQIVGNASTIAVTTTPQFTRTLSLSPVWMNPQQIQINATGRKQNKTGVTLSHGRLAKSILSMINSLSFAWKPRSNTDSAFCLDVIKLQPTLDADKLSNTKGNVNKGFPIGIASPNHSTETADCSTTSFSAKASLRTLTITFQIPLTGDTGLEISTPSLAATGF